jgi:hypothetical protein
MAVHATAGVVTFLLTDIAPAHPVSTLIWQLRAPAAALLALRICMSYSTRLAPGIRAISSETRRAKGTASGC